MMRFMLDQRWFLVGVSEPVTEYLISARCGLTVKNTHSINNAADVQAIAAQALSPAAARTALKLPATGIVFGTVGRCVEGKRHLELLQAFHRFVGDRQDVYLVIIGDGEKRAELDAYIALNQLGETVYLPGYLPGAMHYLRALDVFVFPSDSEGFGLALLEAMALGVPALVNQIEPLASIVADCGVTTDTANTQVFADALEYYYQLSDSERRDLGQLHYQKACDHFDIVGYRAQYLELVERLLEKEN
jgi:glycosyltransferase involved in cell wall biosynthesis